MDQKNNESGEQAGNPATPQDPYAGVTAIPPVPEEPARKQSGPGIASFIIGLLCIVGLIAAVALMVPALAELTPADGSAPDPEQIEADVMDNMNLIMSVVIFMGSLVVSLVGLVLGIVGLVMKNRRKAFAIIGTVLNGLLIFGFAAMLLFGLAMNGMG